jgi:hypothetical protein
VKVPLHRLEETLGPKGIHYKFIKLDTDSVDCELLRELVDRQRKGELTFGSASLEVWSGEHCEGDHFAQLLFDLQEDGYDVYRAPSIPGSVPANNTYDHVRLFDCAPELTYNAARLPSYTLLRMKKLGLDGWKSADREWTKMNQLFVSKLVLPPAGGAHGSSYGDCDDEGRDCKCVPFEGSLREFGPTCDAFEVMD